MAKLLNDNITRSIGQIKTQSVCRRITETLRRLLYGALVFFIGMPQRMIRSWHGDGWIQERVPRAIRFGIQDYSGMFQEHGRTFT